MTCISGPPWMPGKMLLFTALANGSFDSTSPPRGPRSVLWVVVVTSSASGTGEGWRPAATSPAMCAMSTSSTAPTPSAISRKAPKSKTAGVGRSADHDDLRPVLLRQRLHLPEVDALGGAVQAVVDDPVELAGEVERHPVRQVAAGVEVQAEDGVPRLQHGHVRGHVGLAARVRLDVGRLGAEELLRPLDGQGLHLVHHLAAAVVALAGVPLGVLVGQGRADGLHDRGADEVLRGDELEPFLLALGLLPDQGGDVRVHLGEGAGVLHGRPHSRGWPPGLGRCETPGSVDDQDAELARIRQAIEALDRSLLALLRERQVLGQQAARAKIAAAVPLRDPVREAVVLRRARETATELGLDAHQSERLYRLIIDMSVSQQQTHLLELETVPLRVAFLGVEGSPGQLAAQARHGGRRGGALLEGHPSLAEAVEAVRSGRADVALLPLESTLEGSTRTMDLLAEAGLVIGGEEVQRDGEHFTRYVELCREPPAVPEDVPCKTSVIVTLADRAGALDEVLQSFSRQGVNLTRHRVAAGAGHPAPVPLLHRHGGARRRPARVARARGGPGTRGRAGGRAPIRRTGAGRVKVAYAGEPGAFGEEVARMLPDAEPLPCASFAAVFAAVERGAAQQRRGAAPQLARRDGGGGGAAPRARSTASGVRPARAPGPAESPGAAGNSSRGHPPGGVASSGAGPVQPAPPAARLGAGRAEHDLGCRAAAGRGARPDLRGHRQRPGRGDPRARGARSRASRTTRTTPPASRSFGGSSQAA